MLRGADKPGRMETQPLNCSIRNMIIDNSHLVQLDDVGLHGLGLALRLPGCGLDLLLGCS